MNQKKLIKSLEQYFCIEEFVDKQTFKKFGKKAWRFFDPRLLETMLWIRKRGGNPITINNWKRGGKFTQRGLRTNISPLVIKKTNKGRLYLTAHVRGCAIDFDMKGTLATAVRKWLVSLSSELPHKIRLERKFVKSGKEITWVHLDVDDEPKNPKVYLFDV